MHLIETKNRAQFDRDYIERLKSGDPETGRHFMQYFSEIIKSKLRRRLRSATATEDCRQETLLRVLIALKKNRLTSPEALGSFVNSVCNNVLFEIYRRQSATSSSPLSEQNDDVVEDRPNAELVLLREEAEAQVRKALAHLPTTDKVLLHWLFMEGRDKDDICRDLGITRDHLRVRLHRAKARFRGVFLRGTSIGVPLTSLAAAS